MNVTLEHGMNHWLFSAGIHVSLRVTLSHVALVNPGVIMFSVAQRSSSWRAELSCEDGARHTCELVKAGSLTPLQQRLIPEKHQSKTQTAKSQTKSTHQALWDSHGVIHHRPENSDALSLNEAVWSAVQIVPCTLSPCIMHNTLCFLMPGVKWETMKTTEPRDTELRSESSSAENDA